jgi:predicted AlkP superfamily phosphohydrolase/phosphomutase
MIKRYKLHYIIRSRIFASILAGLISSYAIVVSLISLLQSNLLIHRLWYAGNALMLVLMLLIVYGFIGFFLGLVIHLLEHFTIKKIIERIKLHYQLILNYIIISIPVEWYYYSILFEGGESIARLLTYLHTVVLVFLILLPSTLMLITDSLKVIKKLLENKPLKHAAKVLCIIIVFTSTLYLIQSKFRGGSAQPPIELKKPGNTGKYIIFGFDGATWELMDPLLEQGRLPNIKKLIESGVRCNFTSIYYNDYIMSPVVWTTIFTGKTPEKHGITNYVLYVLEDNLLRTHSTPPTSSFRRTKALWNILSDFNISVGFVGLWSTWPAEEVNGFMVSDHLVYLPWHTAESTAVRAVTYPEHVYGEVSRFVLTPGDVDSSVLLRFMTDDSLRRFESEDVPDIFYTSHLNKFKLSYSVDKTYIDTARYLDGRYDPDVLFIYLEGSDIIEHFFWGFRTPELFPEHDITPEEVAAYRNIIDDYYVFYDEVIGGFMGSAHENKTFIILSDHGLAPINRTDNWTLTVRYFADHSPDGVLIVSGPNFRKNHSISNISVLDFTPTLMYSMGLPVAEDMDGRVVEDVFTEAHISGTRYDTVESFDFNYKRELVETPIQDEVEDRLRQLGYLR